MLRLRSHVTNLLVIVVAAMTARGAEPELVSVFPLGVSPSGGVEVALKGSGIKDALGLVFSIPGVSAEHRPDGHFFVTVSDDPTPRDGEVWALTPAGLSNPRRFAVSELAGDIEHEKNDTLATAQPVALNSAVAGTIDPATDRDHFRLALEAGRRVSIGVRSESLEGSVRPALTVIGPDGFECLHDKGGEAEPVLDLIPPTSGEYVVRVEDRAYRRDASSFYHLEVTTGPRLVAAYPSVVRKGQRQAVALFGLDLPGGSPAGMGSPPGLQRLDIQLEAPAEGDRDGGGWATANAALIDGFRYRHPGVRGSVRFRLVDAPVVLEAERPHDRLALAQALEPGQVLAGRFLKPGEVDWYRFSARAGETFWVEAVGERAGLVMDLDLAILDPKGRTLQTFADSAHPKGIPVNCPLDTLDPSGSWKAPADGEYALVVRDLYGTVVSGVERSYSLAVGPVPVEARVLVVPSASVPTRGVAIPRGGKAEMQLIALRRGGHGEPITIKAIGLPSGLSASPVTIDPRKVTAPLTITAATDSPDWAGLLGLEAHTGEGQDTRMVRVVPICVLRDGKTRSARRCDGIAAAVVGKPSEKPKAPPH